MAAAPRKCCSPSSAATPWARCCSWRSTPSDSHAFVRTAGLARLSAVGSATELNLTAPMDPTRLAKTFLSPSVIASKEINPHGACFMKCAGGRLRSGWSDSRRSSCFAAGRTPEDARRRGCGDRRRHRLQQRVATLFLRDPAVRRAGAGHSCRTDSAGRPKS
jgi:hypothetical protein